MHPIITSPQNSKIKNIVALEKARERKAQQVFLIEGLKELTLAVAGGYTLQSVFFCPDIIDDKALLRIVKHERLLIPVERTVFEKVAYRESTGGIIAIATQKEHKLAAIKLSANPLILILEAVEKPGNLGAMLRTADAAGVDAVIICDPQTDFYNSNVVRSSVGCVFTKQVAAASSEETLQWLRTQNVSVYTTYLQASKSYHEIDFRKPSAIVMGTESTGLSSFWVENTDANIIIPMQGEIDSMNVSTAAAVVIFEACRQRGFSVVRK
ncbi:TrmH family RNA methyltransferase [Pseudochryseolinea flava]|uniref:RNA methyltransferase n=1 Tax=Pseudochryseolinea flava TaxID=2059302 RepID=A0A364Y549_9BACT|nr:RNA methyltransferase [Pseudochryseolinea flava]RAW01879.1 RNA methyltransferase [Pseudochryseolinea flava]